MGLATAGPLQSPGAAAGTAPAAPARLTVAVQQGVDTLNPFLGVFVTSTQLFRLTYDFLTGYRISDNRPMPGLAESWTTSADGLTWTFRIRGGVRWSDGVPLTAADIAYTYNVIMKHRTMANWTAVQNFSSVTAPDATTLVIRTRVTVPTMLTLDVPIVPEHVWTHLDPTKDLPANRIPVVGSGPFRLVEAKTDQYVRLEANPDYWRGAPKVGELMMRYFTNSDAAVQALRRGEVDVVGALTPAQFAALAKDPKVGLNEAKNLRFTDLGFNPGAARADGSPIGDGHPALRDARVRQAIEYGIDRKTLVARVLGGRGQPGASYFPPTYVPWSWQPGPGNLRDFDSARANALLDAAGYRRGPGGVRTMPTGGPDGGRKLEFRLYAPAERAHYQQSATYIAGWLKNLGIVVHPQTMVDTQLNERTGTGRYDLFLGGWLYDPDPDFLLSVQTCGARPDASGSGTSDVFHCNRDYDRLGAQQSREIDQNRRVALVKQMQQRLYADANQVVLYHQAGLEAYRRDRFTNLLRRPAASGSIMGEWSYTAATPVEPSTGGGSGATGVLIGGAVVIVAAALGGLAGWRRRASRHLRE